MSSGILRRLALVRTDVWEERRFLQELHGVTFQKTPFFIVTAVKTSDLTQYWAGSIVFSNTCYTSF
jgi:hypothetical protein